MNNKAGTNGRVVDTSNLQHPLPEEIQKMQRDDTVCKFCGVSYLIHNEIKNLEDKLKALEAELAHLKGMEEREENLKYELRKVNMDLSDSQNTITVKDDIIDTLNAQLKTKDEDILLINEKKKILESTLAESAKQVESYKLQNSIFQQNLPSIFSSVQSHKQSFLSIKDMVKERDRVLAEECQTITTVLSNQCSKLNEDLKEVNTKVLEYQQKLEDCQRREAAFKEELSNKARDSEKLSQIEAQCRQSEFENEVLKGKLHSMEKDLEISISNNRTATMEVEQFKEQMRKQSQEMEKLQSQIKNREQQLEQQIDKMRKEVNKKEFELDSVKRDLGSVKRKLEDHERREADIQKKASKSSIKEHEMKEQLERAKCDLEAMKREREMMITAHQNQIEQLRESFKRRIAEADKWPERMEATINKEREKHLAEMEALENQLKENFVMELQIEKQKHQELIEKYMTEVKENEQKLKSQLNSIGGKHKSEIGELHRQIAETKKRSREIENTLRREIENLKSIIRDLEARLGKIQDGSPEKMLGVKTQLIETQVELENKRQEVKKLESQLATVKEDVHFLQETVRRECEERLELTEALSQCKEDLLAYRRPPGGYSARPGSSSSDNRAASTNSTVASRSEEVMLFKKANRQPQVPYPPKGISSARENGTSGSKEVASTPSVSVGFDGDKTKGPGKGMKGGTVVEQRKRIAQAVGRK